MSLHADIIICITQCVPQEKHLSVAVKDVSRKLRSNPIKQTLTKAFPTLITSSKVGFQHSAKRNKKHGPYVRPAKRECILMKQFSSVLPKSKDQEPNRERRIFCSPEHYLQWKFKMLYVRGSAICSVKHSSF